MPFQSLKAQSDSRLPLYHRLRETLAGMIVSRRWDVGAAIPAEAELAQKYQVSIGTVRKAIELLINDGLVDRVQGRGTFVRRPTFSSSLFRFFRSPISGHTISTAESVILHREIAVPPTSAAMALRLERGANAILMKRLRYSDDAPILFEEIWLPIVPFAPLIDFSNEQFGPLLYPLYEREFGVVVTKAREHLTIDKAAKDIASKLNIKADDPIVVIERTAFAEPGRGIEWRRSMGSGARFHYQIEV